MSKMEHDDLNTKLKAAGMFTIEQMMDDEVSGLGPFDTHVGVKTFEDVCAWVDRKRLEYTRMRARDELGPKSELYEWTLAHSAAFTTISKHLRKVAAAQSQSGWVDMEEYKSRGENKAHVVLIPYGVKQVVLVSPNQENNPFQCLRVDVPPSPKEQE